MRRDGRKGAWDVRHLETWTGRKEADARQTHGEGRMVR